MEIFIISKFIYDNRDESVWSAVKAFESEDKARELFKTECKNMLNDAMGVDYCDDPDEYYDGDEKEHGGRVVYMRESGGPVVYGVRLSKEDIH